MTSSLHDITTLSWFLLAFGTMIIGVSKTALPGISTISIAVFAAVLPAKASTGVLLLLLIVGDMFALLSYRKHADWRTLIKLIPAVAVGLALGALFLALSDDTWVRKLIGAILLVVMAFTLWQRNSATVPTTGRIGSAAYGSLGGFTTMVANAGGPVMAMYFLAARFSVKSFLGTAAWFFAIINLSKVPISIGLGIITTNTLLLVLMLVPGVIVGAFIGRLIAARINQKTFEWVVIIFTIIGAIYLLL